MRPRPPVPSPPSPSRRAGRLRRRSLLVVLAGVAVVPAAGRVASGPAEVRAAQVTRTEPEAAVEDGPTTTSRPSTTVTPDGVLVPPATTAAASAAATPTASPVVSSLGRSGIPVVALQAYVRAASTMAVQSRGCGIPWTVVAAIGRVESDHGRYGGSELRADGLGTRPIRGIPLDGRPGVAHISDTDGGALDDDPVYDRAVGPMQFIPSSWRRVAVDGNGDREADPDNIYDAALAATVYLCAAGGDLRQEGGRRAAVYSYNHSWAYVATVLGLADQYAAGGFAALPGAPPSATPIPEPATPLPPATPGHPLGVPEPALFRPVTPPATPPTTTTTTTSTTTTTTTTTTTPASTTTTVPCPEAEGEVVGTSTTVGQPCAPEPGRAEPPPADPVAAPAPGS